MYGDDEDSGAEDTRPLSFIASKYGGEHLDHHQGPKPGDVVGERLRLVRTTSDQTSTSGNTYLSPEPKGMYGGGIKKAQTFPARLTADRPKSPLPPLSPTPSLRDVQNASASQFALTDIDNPSDIAQELSNLQALRRMSMDVGSTTDPDLLQFSGVSLMEIPPIAPTGDDDEADPSRLLWVPARVHPELEPTAFKNFLEKRVQSIKRRSGDSFLSVDGLQRNDSGSLRRKKSMLSRQVNSGQEGGDGFVDGADRLARQRSLHDHTPELSLSELVNDPTATVQKLAQEARQESGEGDSPILQMAPGMGLRRSTKTTYRKGGSQRYGDRTFSKRLASRNTDQDASEEPPPVPPIDPSIGKPLVRVQSEPITENYSRPTRTVRRQQNFSRDIPTVTVSDELSLSATPSSPPKTEVLPVRSSSTSAARSSAPAIPQIIETPPADDTLQQQQPQQPQAAPQGMPLQGDIEQPPIDPPARSSKRPVAGQPPKPPAPAARASSVKEQGPAKQNPALGEINQPHALPGSSGTNTSNLTFIPTFDSIEKKLERRAKEKEETESVVSHKSTSSWKWFKSDDKEKKKREKEKEREREREREREQREELARKAKAKSADKSHDHARMDVIQSSIDNVPKGRESLRLDRDSIEGLPQDKNQTNRKSSEGKKDREGFFGGLFGGSKKKGDKEASHKKKEQRPRTPDPPPRLLQPDIDYPWTRFPIIEERAIYRMAHIKLANPRRPLHSQVLLSNFMYSYLAKVQAMHPQLQIPVSPQQKRQEEERKRREAEEAQLQMEQQMAAQQAAQDGNFDFEYHRVSPATNPPVPSPII